MKVIGVTGGIGSGKTIVSKVIEAMGYPIYNSDIEAKKIVTENNEVKQAVIALLGEESYLRDGSYNRRYVAEHVFKNEKMLNELNAIIHPAVKDHFKEWCDLQDTSFVFKESALLLDKDFSADLDAVIAVVASDATRVKRIQKRDPFRSLDDIKRIIRSQGDWSKKSSKATFLISNDNDFIVDQVKTFIKAFSDRNMDD